MRRDRSTTYFLSLSYKVIFQTKKEDINMTDTVEETHELKSESPS